MRLMTLLLAFFLVSTVKADTLRIGVIDSGLSVTDPRLNGHLCPTGHKDFTGEGLTDTNGHGTAMVGLIEEYAGTGDYCIVLYKYYRESDPGSVNLEHEVEALEQASKDKVSIINISGGGPIFEEKEYLAIRGNPQILFVVAAGNEGQNIDFPGNEFYPASYNLPNEIIVGNVDKNNKRVSTSNYGERVVVVEMGDHVRSTYIAGYSTVTGTSASTAIHTGKFIRTILDATR